MNAVNQALIISNLGMACLGILVAIPLVLRKVPPNGWYGVRLAKSFRSKEDWYKINTWGAWRLSNWSIIHLALTIAIWIFYTVLPFKNVILPAMLGCLLYPLF